MAAYPLLSLEQQVTALQEGAASAESLLADQFIAIDQRNSALNALVHCCDHDALLKEARASDARRSAGATLSVLDGIALPVKDNIDVAGEPITSGLGTPPRVSASDADVVQRARSAGVLLLGKLNMDEAALGATNDNPHLGRANNPHREGYTPGGSSGGSGAWVAAGLGPVALGTDTMGSVRVPAAYCGISAIKPTRGWLSNTGVTAVSYRLDSVGCWRHGPPI